MKPANVLESSGQIYLLQPENVPLDEGPDKTPLDRIIDAGFDGVYLDIIDGYLYWSEEGGNELSRRRPAA